jgi:polyphosphate glucokinase
MRVLVVDVGGTRVKVRLSDGTETRRFPSGPTLTPDVLIDTLRHVTADWSYDVVSLGYPGAVAQGAPSAEPGNLAEGWVGYDFAAAFERPVRVVNDAVLQALGAYRSGRMLFLGLGTGVGSALVSEYVVVPLELGCLPHHRGGTLADHLGRAARAGRGHAVWEADVLEATPRLRAALAADYVVLGGGNGRKVDPLPENTYRGRDTDAFDGGARLWEDYVEPHDAEPPLVWRVVR